MSGLSLVIGIMVLALGSPSAAEGEPTIPGRGGATSEVNGGNGSIDTTAQREVVADQVSQGPPGTVVGDTDPERWYEYVVVVNCDGNTPDRTNVEVCAAAVTYCADNGQGSTIWHRMYRRVVSVSGAGSWEQFGTTCFPEALPARSGGSGNVLGLSQIITQFHATPFALPHTSIEPPHGATLVNFPTFFEVQWPAQGVQPQEIDSTVLIGHHVRIRPTFINATYDFGDGNTHGPVTSLGGTWPNGDIQHIYDSKDTLTPSISVTYGGEYSIDGNTWQPIPDTITIDGPPQPLTVHTSRNRLVRNPNLALP